MWLGNLHFLSTFISPKLGLRWKEGIRGHRSRFVMSNFIYVLNDNKVFTNGLSFMNQYRNFLMNMIHLKQKRTLVHQVLFFSLIFDSLLNQCSFHSHCIRTWPRTQETTFSVIIVASIYQYSCLGESNNEWYVYKLCICTPISSIYFFFFFNFNLSS